MQFRVLIDATHFSSERATGVENYVRHLLPLLSSELNAAGVEVLWVGHTSQSPKGMPAYVRWVHSSHRPFWSQLVLPGLLRRERPNLFFTPSGIPPVGYRGKTVVTVHDMSAYVSPDVFSAGQRLRLKTLMGMAVRHARAVFTPSTYSQEMVTKIWKIPADRIIVTPLSADAPSKTEQHVKGINTDEPILLFISRVESKKNVGRLVEAFGRLGHPTAQLVLAGKEGVGIDELRQQIEALPAEVSKRVFQPGYITDAQREWLLNRAAIFLVPGALEGFSLPLLEAFGHGIPAICAPAGPLPEIGGDACLYADADNTSQWVAQMEKLLKDAPLRQLYSKAGKKRAEEYSWPRTAARTAAAMLAILKG
jgi:glycosyltransferase involved in cell wall biosynthesis